MKSKSLLLVSLIAAAVLSAQGQAAYLGRIGFYDTEHNRGDGYEYSVTLGRLSGTGGIGGFSNRYNGGSLFRGRTAWIGSVSGVTYEVGFYDAEHTDNFGSQYSATEGDVSNSGYVGGNSWRFHGDSSDLGQTAWIGSAAGTTMEVGFYDAEHSRDDDYQFSVTQGKMNESGFIGGYSFRFNGTNNKLGQTAWIGSSAGTTTRVGFYDAEHSGAGYQESGIQGDMSESGHIGGYSVRYTGGGQTAWIASIAGTTTEVGFYDTAHSRSSGYQFSQVVGNVSEGGYVGGYSLRYSSGNSQLGQTAWIASTFGMTTKVGFSDAEHTRNDGYQYSTVRGDASESGYVGGYSSRYNGGSSLGTTAWIGSVAGTTTEIGFYDSDHSRADGNQSSLTQGNVSESGFIGGSSERYNGSTWLGRTAWIGSVAGTTVEVGFYDAEHTHSDGYQFSLTQGNASENGHIAGYSSRFNGGTSAIGQTVWIGSAAGTTNEVGVYDAVHTRDDGYQFSAVSNLDDYDYAWGYSSRFNGDSVEDGQTAWIYDITNNMQFEMTLSVRSSDGYAFSQVNDINSSGLAVGTYVLFDDLGNSLGDRAFVWSADLGAVDLGDTFAASLSTYGWESLTSGLSINETGQIVGTGFPSGSASDSQGVFLVQIVPEPTSVLLLLLSSALFFNRRRNEGRSIM